VSSSSALNPFVEGERHWFRSWNGSGAATLNAAKTYGWVPCFHQFSEPVVGFLAQHARPDATADSWPTQAAQGGSTREWATAEVSSTSMLAGIKASTLRSLSVISGQGLGVLRWFGGVFGRCRNVVEMGGR